MFFWKKKKNWSLLLYRHPLSLFWISMTIFGPKLSHKTEDEFFSWVGWGNTVKPLYSRHLLLQTTLYNKHFSQKRMKWHSNSHDKTSVEQGQKCGYNHGDILFCCIWRTTSSLQCELVKTTATTFLPTSLVGSFMYYKHAQTSGFQIII